MKKHFQYASYVLRHKWFVFIECYKFGIFWRGIKHDLSKFFPSEWFPYTEFFYGDKKRKIRDETGYYKPTDTGDEDFDFAWLLHAKRNDHHWQWWTTPEEDGGLRIFPMEENSILEMVADWRGAGRAQKTPDTIAWYHKNKDKLKLHPDTRKRVEELIGYKDG